MLFQVPLPTQSKLRDCITEATYRDETELVQQLIAAAQLTATEQLHATETARQLVEEARSVKRRSKGIDSFLTQYSLTSEEGIALMCLAEALLRIPDKETIDELIRDKLSHPNWQAHLGGSESLFINATTWALMLTGKLLQPAAGVPSLQHGLKSFINRTSETMIRHVIAQAMKILGRQFVMGRTIERALKRASKQEDRGYRYSFDMLGEAALTHLDAERYFAAYSEAIHKIGAANAGRPRDERGGISIKLSALHPRYEFSKRTRVLHELIPKLLNLCVTAKQYDIDVTIDAEEARRLELSLDIIECVFRDPQLEGWDGFGIALQSYQKRAFFVIDWLVDLAKSVGRKLKIRLIKGAYWDTEIKQAQVQGHPNYPVFTRKSSTDISFQACARKLIANQDYFYLQFATHNAYSVALILTLVTPETKFEFQCLHGMGKELYQFIVPKYRLGIPCRVYAPVGNHKDLLPYLVRRLLENGANSSFVNRLVDDKAPVDDIIADPIRVTLALTQIPHPKIPLPSDVFLPIRQNSSGIDLSDRNACLQLEAQLKASARQSSHEPVNSVTADDCDQALTRSAHAFESWNATLVSERANILRGIAELLQEEMGRLMYSLATEGGKTLPDAMSEVREAIDYCRYYAAQAELVMADRPLPGYTGETNVLKLTGRGVMLCISPWNFPLAIFLGQIIACLATGNTVIAKPAKQTPLIALEVMRLCHQAGVPTDVLQVLIGSGAVIGPLLMADTRIAGVLLTGSTDTAKSIAKTLAERSGPIIPFIAETGGQNALIVDSSALLEQVVNDVIQSAFGSAGQRCSALRVCYIQKDIATPFMTMLSGAMAELELGDPLLLDTDIGPVIDAGAQSGLQAHLDFLEAKNKRLIAEVPRPVTCPLGSYFPPRAYQIDSIDELPGEIFGPILHVIEYDKHDLGKVIDAINSTGYGLTFGLHSRIDETIEKVCRQVKVGNCYVNRNMIGAVVGLQPFGGEGLSGTGPKAGGPHYLIRLCHERTLTINTSAAGGNASLLASTG